jgi:hypothetical protein
MPLTFCDPELRFLLTQNLVFRVDGRRAAAIWFRAEIKLKSQIPVYTASIRRQFEEAKWYVTG